MVVVLILMRSIVDRVVVTLSFLLMWPSGRLRCHDVVLAIVTIFASLLIASVLLVDVVDTV